MIKQAMSAAGLEILAVGGLLLFVAVFTGVCLWVTTRSRKEVDTWSSLPLADGTDPVESRFPTDIADDGPTSEDTARRAVEQRGGSTADAGDHGAGGCGKCAECTCVANELVSVATFSIHGA
ncbi:MAG: hypothetical protein AAFV43_05890 [Planctomycetota bacterium]